MAINIDKNVCTGCRECAEVCPAYAVIGEQGEPQSIDTARCVMCGQCVQKCKSYVSILSHGAEAYEKTREERGLPDTLTEPLFAAYFSSSLDKVKEVLEDKNIVTMVQCAPAVRVAIAEEFGLPLGTLASGKLSAALRSLGFDKIYDANFPADLTIMEEGTELINRITNGGVLPMFTSCCPAWVTFLERNYPEMKDHLSSCKSPQQMGGAVFKTYGAKVSDLDPSKICSISVMPCTCKEFESKREEMNSSGYRDVDLVITTRELAWLLKEKGIDFSVLPEEEFDQPLGIYTGAGTIFGVTGGVMEAAIRTGYELITKETIPSIDVLEVRDTKEVRTATIKVGELNLRVGVVSGLQNIIPVLEAVKSGELDLHFIEVMTCPVGCVSGGGQPKLLLDADKEECYEQRRKSTFDHDSQLPIRKSHENPAIIKIYEDYFEQPNSEKSHHLLHTHYCEGANKHN